MQSLALSVIVGCLTCTPAQADTARCVEGILSFQALYKELAATVETRTIRVRDFDESDGRIPADRLVSTSRIRLLRSNLMAHSFERYTYRTMNAGKLVERDESMESLVRPDIFVCVPRDPQTEKYEGTNLIAAFPSADNAALYRILFRTVPFLFSGRFELLGPDLGERVQKADLKYTQAVLGGKMVPSLEFEDEWGSTAIWFDTSHDFHPVRVLHRKSPSHLVRPNVRMADVPENQRVGKIVDIRTDFSIPAFQSVGRMWFAHKIEISETYTTEAGQAAETRITAQLSEIKPGTNSDVRDFTLVTKVPDDARVAVQGQPQIKYKWQSGQVLKAVDAASSESLASQRFMPEPRSWIWQLTFAAIGLVLILTILLWYRLPVRRPEQR